MPRKAKETMTKEELENGAVGEVAIEPENPKVLDDIRQEIFGSIKMGKRPQRKSLLTNPKSKWYNPTIAKRRAKEKHRRHVNQLKRK